ncbi:hypothetical protein EGR_02273 [Echinococcus granulosus]|uniref:Uncharacterized protein n=1 Tax=Echinococcus granulosus TaxID=6210 RepID=W6UWG8_ECHGR|nr:hypothetical protein EGR_02273 [Echinococcus granulosus]EUB62832.1 hypothetical protein EGR_02273 [Echinococcus granulosus]
MVSISAMEKTNSTPVCIAHLDNNLLYQGHFTNYTKNCNVLSSEFRENYANKNRLKTFRSISIHIWAERWSLTVPPCAPLQSKFVVCIGTGESERLRNPLPLFCWNSKYNKPMEFCIDFVNRET